MYRKFTLHAFKELFGALNVDAYHNRIAFDLVTFECGKVITNDSDFGSTG